MVEALTTIETAVRTMVTLIDAMGRDGGDGPPDAAG